MSVTSHALADTNSAKDVLLEAILDVVHTRGWNQMQTAAILRTNQSRVSELNRRKLRQFSLDKLIEYARILDIDVKLVIDTAPTA